ncbi:Hypothetical predicted protein, partial [Mytilus galloprovincialis]
NDNTHAITRQRFFKVRLDFEGRTTYAIYTVFAIYNKGTNYTLSIEEYSGTAGSNIFVQT